MRRDMAAPAASLSSRIDRGGRDKIGPAERAASAGEAAMSAAMINVGLMRESRVPIRNVTAHAYDCVSVVATGPRLAGSPLVAYRLRPRPRSHLPTSMATLHKAHQDIHSVAGSCPAAKSELVKGRSLTAAPGSTYASAEDRFVTLPARSLGRFLRFSIVIWVATIPAASVRKTTIVAATIGILLARLGIANALWARCFIFFESKSDFITSVDLHKI